MGRDEVARACSVYESPAWQLPGDVFRPGGLKLTNQLISLCGFSSGSRVIDVGCGIGITVEYLLQQGFAVLGVDPSAPLIKRGLERNPALPLIQASGDKLPLLSGEADGLLAECSLSVMPDVDEALAEFSRVLRPGGKLAVSDVYVRNEDGTAGIRALPDVCCLSGAFSQKVLKERLLAHGFTVDYWEDCSEVWKAFVAMIIMEYGSLSSWWGCASEAETVTQAVRQARPGYFIMVATKRGADE